ncbi:MAG: hypothetical protein IJG80_09265 [Selenomonadaceae bacterium]|nr:hypothetical protein [Selenomonadaceae bacterium]MBQ3433689.1 hypothetical protein [Selenomonadaceae bacterium]
MAYNANDVAKLGHLASLASKTKQAIDALDAKYDGVQENVIETIKVNNTALTVTNKAVNIDLTPYALKTDIAGGLRVKGSVANYAALPANATVGDMYNITNAGGTDENGVAIKAGDNVVKTETGWDNFGGTVDLSNYVQKDGAKQLSTEDFTTAFKTKLEGIEAGADVNVIESVKVDGTALTVDANKAVNIDLSGKVDKVTGKGLSTEDYTTAEKTKLGGVEEGAQVNVIEAVQVNGTALNVASKTVNIDISGKVDKVTTATSGNIVVFGAGGVLVDSGIKFASDTDVNAMLEEYFPSGD